MKPLLPLRLKYSAAVIGSILLVGCNSSTTDPTTQDSSDPTAQVTVYYKANPTVLSTADSSSYDTATLYVWNDDSCSAYAGDTTDASDWSKGLEPTGVDSENGAYWTLDVNSDDSTQCVNFIPRTGADNSKPLGDYDAQVDLTQLGTENSVYTREGVASVMPELISALPENTVRIYMNTQDGDENAFKLHTWNNDTCGAHAGDDTSWPGMEQTGISDTYGVYWDVPVSALEGCLNIIPNNSDGGGSYQTADLKFEFDKVTAVGNVGFIFKGTDKVYYQPMKQLPVSKVSFSGASAIFADDSTLLVSAADADKVSLYYSADGSMTFDESSQEVTGATYVITSSTAAGSAWQASKPHLSEAGFVGFEFDFSDSETTLKEMLKGELIVTATDSAGDIVLATKAQPATALDALYADAAKSVQLGAIINGDTTTFRLWAPTAQQVKLIPYNSDKEAQTAIDMTFDSSTGIWEVADTALGHGDLYKYELTVYHPQAEEMETYQVTDPYSLSLSMNSEYSQVVNLNNPDLIPSGWDSLESPHAQDNPAEFVIYEGHVRDFSAHDASTPAEMRGKYEAFTQTDSDPVTHLKALSESGVTHLHLLPVFDIATINEDPSKVADIDQPFSKLCELNSAVADDTDFGNYCSSADTIADVFTDMQAKDSVDNPVVQRLNGYVRNVDSFNWGYDPYHYTVPEGSYSSDADSMTRIKEFRDMVTSIKKDIGMNVVMDVVYNHTNESGVSDKSVLDKIVPWYYQRLNPMTGSVESSTCCSNTAPENAMMGKLIADSLVVWARDYKIDAFRWDLMGHHPKQQILNALAKVKEVDADTYFYGEGWNFGEVANDAMFVQATQANMYGTGVGTYSDRMRDAVRGGGPFDGGDGLRANQGFGNGAFVYPNDKDAVDRATALHLMDLVRVGMAGNLKDYSFTDSTGKVITGGELDYNGQAAGYAKDADEIQNYIAKHDNQTLWDNNQYKIPYAASLDTRVRMQAVGMSTVLLGQGVVFTQMGSDILRSKSMQRDSYDSGDWYNQVDFSETSSDNWNKGLPRKDKDGDNYAVINDVISGSGERADITPAAMTAMNSYFRELASIRSSSPLFTLNDGEKINQAVKFHNTGADQTAGLIVMSIDGGTTNNDIVIVINATNETQVFTGDIDTQGYALHPKHIEMGDASIAAGASVTGGAFSVPAWSTAVFEKAAQ
ncbi:pullulanase-type alpha-1,6-glucosidase [Vibrio albus]|uniref:pullulanase-type alpha-1,6-glucosidase n=1 Tax=Vibrio albus TaxID=2200953 RepID=UPI001FEA7631|nr:pullulanase-type alpha-1,6-glucosidase [Vibrio albus]